MMNITYKHMRSTDHDVPPIRYYIIILLCMHFTNTTRTYRVCVFFSWKISNERVRKCDNVYYECGCLCANVWARAQKRPSITCHLKFSWPMTAATTHYSVTYSRILSHDTFSFKHEFSV